MACCERSGARSLDRRAGPLQRAVGRGHRRVQRLRRLARGEAEHVAQDQHRPLRAGELLQRGHERQLDALAQLVARVGRRRARRRRLGVGLDPHRLQQRPPERRAGLGGRAEVDREHARLAPLDRAQAAVGGDRVQPGAQRAAALEPPQPAPGAQPRLLLRVLGVVHRAEHAVAVRVQLASQRLDEPRERALVAGARGVEVRERAQGCTIAFTLFGSSPPIFSARQRVVEVVVGGDQRLQVHPPARPPARSRSGRCWRSGTCR